ncbi:MAG TPA: DUF6178 family protein [Myxococcales bacterium]
MGSVAIQDLRAVRRALADARGRRKIDLLLEAPDPVALVRALPPEELYLALLDVGPEDAAEVVALASPEQFRHFIDLSAWPRSDAGPNPSAIVRWLRIAREGAGGRHQGRLRAQLAGLDVELLALILRRELTVHELSDDVQPEPANPNLAWYTPDRRFLLEFASERDFEELRQVIDDLYAQDVFAAGRLLESVRWEVPTELEETARRWRQGRLRDLGVPDLDEALAFYARPASTVAPAEPAQSTALTAPARPLLDEVLSRLTGAELDAAEEAIVYAANAALVANRTPLDDALEVRDQLDAARATLSLGLELLSAGDPERAAQLLLERPIREIFQAAMGETYRLQARARKLLASLRLPQAQTTTLLDEPLESAVQALSRQRPLLHEPGKRRPRAFGSRADLSQAEAFLDEGQEVLDLLLKLELSPARLGPLADEAGLGAAVLKASSAVTALAISKLRNEAFSLKPLADEERQRPEGFDELARQLVPGPQTLRAALKL